MRVGIKYCGGCNPDYDRVELVEHIEKRLHGKALFVAAEDRESFVKLISEEYGRSHY